MKQKYKDGDVIAPGTVIISAGGNCDNVTQVVEPVLQKMVALSITLTYLMILIN
ncbi:Phosphoribosylformylglycinamidine synthase [compost metagenome]